MNVVDSSGWLAYFADEPNAEHFAAVLADTDGLVVPAIVIYEVCKVLLREAGEEAALQALGAMGRGLVIAVDARLAVVGAKLSLQHSLPMADSLILATARNHGATLWTQDVDFDGIPGVRYVPK
ncbi:MAG: type II toxin-antitoxin system VapC family toxin [Lentisphaerae bacterium]|nr:type II toxin-antitoxin system VapC family toxin [Lentisphaerota bacterium]